MGVIKLRRGRLKAYLEGVNGPEIVVGLLGLGGWALTAWGLAELIGQSWVWKLSAGLLLLGLFGYGTVWQLFRAGILGLNQGADEDGTSSDSRTKGSNTIP